MWKTVKLGDICFIQSGNSIAAKKKTELFTNVIGTPYVATKDIGFDGNINYKNGIYIPQEYVNSFKISQSGSTLVCAEGGSAGRKIAFSMDDCCFVNKLYSITPNESLEAKYIYYYALSEEFQSQFKAALHGLIGGVSLRKIKEFTITIPPLGEQQRIVAKLDAAFAETDGAIALADEQIKDNHQLFVSAVESRFKNREDWEKKTLQDVCEKITDGTHQTPKYVDDGYIFLSSKNVTARKIDWINIKYIDEEQHVAMQRRLSPRKGDILLAKNGTTGVAAMVDRDIEFDIYVSLAWLRSKGEVTPQYLLQFINSNAAKAQFSKRLKGVGVPNLHLKEIREVEICFPASISMQNEVSTLIEKIDSLYQHRHSVLRKKKENLNELKSALLKKELQPSEAA